MESIKMSNLTRNTSVLYIVQYCTVYSSKVRYMYWVRLGIFKIFNLQLSVLEVAA